ncbi:MAG: hypothetical protein KDA52_20815, partial [Planctomycetaceae bacterium]|nr:hypothetical protein [Planctomycetaceae bacterium]
MRWKQAVAAILGLAFVPGLVSAQFYQQDFTYAPGFVTVTLTNMDTGDTITPFENHPVNGLWDYVGRPQLQARTGGASATQQVGAINSSYTVNGTDNAVVYEVDPLPAVGGNGAYTPQLGVFDAALVALSEEGINDVQSAIAWDQQYDGPANQARHDFVFSISGAGDPMNDFADGIGWAYLNSDVYGTSGVVGPGTSEEPTFEESLGVGFDIYDNGNEGGNSVSLHFDGRAIASRTIDPDTTNPNTGQPWDFNSFETDELIQATILVSPN